MRSVRGWALPLQECPTLGRAARGQLPFFFACGGCWCDGLSPTPQRMLLRAGVVHCWGGRRPPGEQGTSSLCGRCLGFGTLPSPPVCPGGACGPGRLPVFLGRGGLLSGGASATPQHTRLGGGIAHRGVGKRAPSGGTSCLREACLHSGTLPPPIACRGSVQLGSFSSSRAHALASWACAP